MAVGLAGLVWLAMGQGFAASPSGLLAVLTASFAWKLGSVWSQRGLPRALGGRPLTLVAASDELRPFLSLGHRFALAHEGRWRILGSAADVLAAREDAGVREILGDND